MSVAWSCGAGLTGVLVGAGVGDDEVLGRRDAGVGQFWRQRAGQRRVLLESEHLAQFERARVVHLVDRVQGVHVLRHHQADELGRAHV